MRAAIALVIITGCGKEPATSSGAHAGSAVLESGTTRKPDELLGEPIADGTAWRRGETVFGTAELPTGDGWTVTPALVAHADGSRVVLETAEGIEPAAIADHAAAWVANHQRSQPTFRAGAPTLGTVKGNRAARIEATVDTGRTRAYILVTPNGRAVVIDGSTPTATPPTRLAAIVDHIVATAQIR